jgi:hypothetical protein
MKPVNIKSSVGLDRLATCNEIRYAMSTFSQVTSGLVGDCDDSPMMDSDCRDGCYNLPEDIM